MSTEKDCHDILQRLSKLEQKTEDLEDFVKHILLQKIENLDKKITVDIGNTRNIIEQRFKWFLGLFILFFISTVIPLIFMIAQR